MQRLIFILLAAAIACLCLFVPVPEGLTAYGFMVLCVAAGVLLLWITQAVDFSASSFFLMGFLALLGGLINDVSLSPEKIGSAPGIRLAMQGFATPAWILVAAALFLAAAVDISGLGRRLGFWLFLKLGVTPRRVRLGAFLLVFIFSAIIPSPAACAGLSLVVLLSLVEVFGISRTGNLSKGLFLTVGFGPMISALMILTAGGGPVQIAAYIYNGTGHELTWLAYAVYGMPMTVGIFATLYVLLNIHFPLGEETLEDGLLKVQNALQGCGKMCLAEKWVLWVLLMVIPLWITSKVLHPVDNATIAVLAVALLCAVGSVCNLAKFNFELFLARVPWGTLMLFGSVLSLGQALLDSGGAAWLTRQTLVRFGLSELPLWGIVIGGGAVYGLFSLAFSARSASIAALAPTIIAFAQSIPEESGISTWGIALVLCYMVQLPVVLPANSPMAMIAYSSNSFTAKDMAKVGSGLVLAAICLMGLFSQTIWKWLGIFS